MSEQYGGIKIPEARSATSDKSGGGMWRDARDKAHEAIGKVKGKVDEAKVIDVPVVIKETRTEQIPPRPGVEWAVSIASLPAYIDRASTDALYRPQGNARINLYNDIHSYMLRGDFASVLEPYVRASHEVALSGNPAGQQREQGLRLLQKALHTAGAPPPRNSPQFANWEAQVRSFAPGSSEWFDHVNGAIIRPLANAFATGDVAGVVGVSVSEARFLGINQAVTDLSALQEKVRQGQEQRQREQGNQLQDAQLQQTRQLEKARLDRERQAQDARDRVIRETTQSLPDNQRREFTQVASTMDEIHEQVQAGHWEQALRTFATTARGEYASNTQLMLNNVLEVFQHPSCRPPADMEDFQQVDEWQRQIREIFPQRLATVNRFVELMTNVSQNYAEGDISEALLLLQQDAARREDASATNLQQFQETASVVQKRNIESGLMQIEEGTDRISMLRMAQKTRALARDETCRDGLIALARVAGNSALVAGQLWPKGNLVIKAVRIVDKAVKAGERLGVDVDLTPDAHRQQAGTSSPELDFLRTLLSPIIPVEEVEKRIRQIGPDAKRIYEGVRRAREIIVGEVTDYQANQAQIDSALGAFGEKPPSLPSRIFRRDK